MASLRQPTDAGELLQRVRTQNEYCPRSSTGHQTLDRVAWHEYPASHGVPRVSVGVPVYRHR